MVMLCLFFKQKTAYEMRISDWSSDVCSSDLAAGLPRLHPRQQDRLPTSDPVIEAIRKRTDLAAWFMGNARRACARSRLFIMSSPILFLSGGSALVLSAIPFTPAHADAVGDPSIIFIAQSATHEAPAEIETRPGAVNLVAEHSSKDKVTSSV